MTGLYLTLAVLLPLPLGFFARWIQSSRAQKFYVWGALTISLALAFLIALGAEAELTVWRITDTLTIFFRSDGMARFFVPLFAVLYAAAGLFAFEYMKHEERPSSFFSWYVMSLAPLTGVALAGNMFTFYLCFELMTLMTLPLVLHTRTEQSRKAGIKYLGYSLFGAGLGLLGFFMINGFTAAGSFRPGGALDVAAIAGKEGLVLVAVFLMLLGFGAKAGLWPLHAWLPSAHPVAPAPASAVLSGAITKAGLLGIIRCALYLVGADLLRGSWVQTVMLILALFTIFMGSMLAYKEKLLKRRLAWSTVSQVSYAIFGVMLLNSAGLSGALLQALFHMLAKGILFLTAGAVIYKTHRERADEFTGLGRAMPCTMAAFTLASLSLIGIPPLGGFASKWQLAMGALSLEQGALGVVGVAVLLVSALLTAGYLLRPMAEAYFPGKSYDAALFGRQEPNAYMLIPLFVLLVLAFAFGLFPGSITDASAALAAGLL